MKMKRVFAPVAGAFLLVLTQPSLAEDPFHFNYRHQAMSSDGLTQSGILLLTVVNVSGQDVRELVVSIPGPNSVTFDNRAIYIGDLAEAQQKEILDEFMVPQELVNPDALQEQITWSVEYTATNDERLTAEVVGEPVSGQ